MASIYDVARYILGVMGPLSAMKLQKLVYYSQAWNLAWLERPLFGERIEAWAGGPVAPELYARHRGQFLVNEDIVSDGEAAHLNDEDRKTIDTVISFYGKHTAQWLSDLTHLESPWKDARARASAAPGSPCSEVITLADMAEYYSGLMSNDSAQTVA